MQRQRENRQMTDRLIEGEMDGYTDIQMDTQIYRLINRYTDGYTDKQK